MRARGIVLADLDIDVSSQRKNVFQQALRRESREVSIHQPGDFGLINSKQVRGVGLAQSLFLEDRTNQAAYVRFCEMSLSVRQADIRKRVPATDNNLSLFSLFLHRVSPPASVVREPMRVPNPNQPLHNHSSAPNMPQLACFVNRRFYPDINFEAVPVGTLKR